MTYGAFKYFVKKILHFVKTHKIVIKLAISFKVLNNEMYTCTKYHIFIMKKKNKNLTLTVSLTEMKSSC